MSTKLALAPKPQYSLAPTTFDEALRFAKIVANSGFAPKGYQNKPDDVLVAVQMGAELGLAPMQALQSIAVINGRPAVWGDAMVAVCMAHPAFGGMNETIDGDTATCSVIRKGMEPVVRTFSMQDAKQAGLIGKQGPWSQYPKRMLQMRARGFALRDAFPDALRGLISQDEANDLPPVKATVVQNTVKREEAPVHQGTIEDPINQKLQREIDHPTPPAIDPEADPEDYTILAKGKNQGKMLRELGMPQLEWYADNSRDPQLRLYAAAALAQRIATSPKLDDDTTGNDAWGLSGEGEVTP